MIRWAGRLLVFYGSAHTLGALLAEGALDHADAWLGRDLWTQDLADMSPAMSAYWLSVNSFGPPVVLVGLTVRWLDRRGITPPWFIPWFLGTWLVIDLILTGPGVGQGVILAVAIALLLVGTRRAERAADGAEGSMDRSAAPAASVDDQQPSR